MSGCMYVCTRVRACACFTTSVIKSNILTKLLKYVQNLESHVQSTHTHTHTHSHTHTHAPALKHTPTPVVVDTCSQHMACYSMIRRQRRWELISEERPASEVLHRQEIVVGVPLVQIEHVNKTLHMNPDIRGWGMPSSVLQLIKVTPTTAPQEWQQEQRVQVERTLAGGRHHKIWQLVSYFAIVAKGMSGEAAPFILLCTSHALRQHPLLCCALGVLLCSGCFAVHLVFCCALGVLLSHCFLLCTLCCVVHLMFSITAAVHPSFSTPTSMISPALVFASCGCLASVFF